MTAPKPHPSSCAKPETKTEGNQPHPLTDGESAGTGGRSPMSTGCYIRRGGNFEPTDDGYLLRRIHDGG